MMWMLLGALAACGLGLFVLWLSARKKVLEAGRIRDEGRIREEELKGRIHELEKAVILREAQLDQERERVREKQEQFTRWGEEVEEKFQHLASRILEDSSQRFVLRQESEMKRVLEPLKADIQQFKQELEQKSQMETRDRVALKEQVRFMMQLNQTLSEQANSLSRAIRGEFRTQGSWGEVVLLGILEQIGLQKGLHYIPQYSARNAEGKQVRPDVMVRLPEGRHIFIDSKVSLVAYERYGQSEGEDRSRSIQDLLRSLKKHIEDLSSRSYGDGEDALDFVLLFVPVEAAYILAMKEDPELWQHAYSRKVLLVSPTSLVATLRMVHALWQKDELHREAGRIGQKVSALYEKLVGFVDNMDKVGAQLDRARDSWEEAYKQLYTGRGNLISRAEQIARSSTQKSLPADLVRRAKENDPAQEESSEE